VLSMANEGQHLVETLGGTWTPRGGMARCPAHADTSPSLSVRPGRTRLLFHCFAGCSNVEVLEALAKLRLSSRAHEPVLERSGGRRDLNKAAIRLWDAARPVHGTPAETYLSRRALNADSRALRFHPRTPFGRKPHTIFAPALIAGLCDARGLVAVQRIFLESDGCLARTINPPKRGLGMPGGAAVRLATPGTVLGLAEGVETGLSAMALFGVPCWASLGTDRIDKIDIPLSVEKLILFLDNDASGRRAETRARVAYGERVDVEPRYPPISGDDWNDVLMRERGKIAPR